MPENAQVFNVTQLFPETTSGTAGAATDIIRDFGVMFTPVVPSTPVQPQGNVFRTTHLYGKEHSEGRIDGSLGYQSFPYLGSSLFHTVTATTPGGTGVWTLTITGTPTGGTFTLTYNGVTSAGIAYNAAASAVQSAMEAMSTIGTGNVTVTGTALPGGSQTITFAGPLTGTPTALTSSSAGLTGGTSPTVVLTASTVPSTSKLWRWTPAQSAPEAAFATYTVEMGSSVTASRVSYAQVADLEINYTLENVTIGGRMLAQRMTDNFGALATGLTEVLVKPVASDEVTVWLGNTYLGMTRMSRPLEARVSINNRVGPVKTLNDQQTSFAALVQLPVEVLVSLTVEHDTETHAFLTDMRAGTTKFMMIEAVGPAAESNVLYRHRITMPCELINPERTDNQGVHATRWDLAAVYRENVIGTRDFALELEVVNTLSAL